MAAVRIVVFAAAFSLSSAVKTLAELRGASASPTLPAFPVVMHSDSDVNAPVPLDLGLLPGDVAVVDVNGAPMYIKAAADPLPTFMAEDAAMIDGHHVAEIPQSWELLGKMAATGLASKLWIDFVPEVLAMYETLQEYLAQGASTLSASRAFVVLSGIRGLHGVQWARTLLLEELETLDRLGDEDDAEVAEFLQELWVAHQAVTPERARKTWARHTESWHTQLSGDVFLHAITQPVGLVGMIEVARMIEPGMRHILDGSLDSDGMEDVLAAIQGRLVLDVDTTTGRVARAGDYNGMDKARALIAFGYFGGYLVHVDLDEALFRSMRDRQRNSKNAKVVDDPCDYFEVFSAVDFAALRTYLAAVAVPLLPVHHAIWWPNVFVMLCEAKQVLNTIGEDAVREVVEADPQMYLESARAKLRSLMGKCAGGASHMMQLFTVALKSVRPTCPAPKRFKLSPPEAEAVREVARTTPRLQLLAEAMEADPRMYVATYVQVAADQGQLMPGGLPPYGHDRIMY